MTKSFLPSPSVVQYFYVFDCNSLGYLTNVLKENSTWLANPKSISNSFDQIFSFIWKFVYKDNGEQQPKKYFLM